MASPALQGDPAAREASCSQRISAFVAGLSFDGLPTAVIESAKRHLLDTLGVGLIGSRQPNAAAALEGVRGIGGGSGQSSVWGTGFRLDAPYAAIANGVACHVLDYDDTHTDSITHGSAVLAPTVLALAEELGASGQEAIAAFAAGWEVTARVGLAARGSFHKRGFHTTSVAGVFGAAAAAAKLLRLSAEQTSHALGLAGSQVSGVSEYLSNGSAAKSFHPGWAASAGIVAAHLAHAGMTGPMTVFEGRYGTFKTYGLVDECDLAALDAGLGERWEMTRVSIKPYPCCHFAHAFIDCVLDLRLQGVTPAQVKALHCVVPEIELPLICEPFAQKLRPDSPYAAKFSLPFVLAAALTDGRIGHDTFTPENIARPDLLELADRMSYRVAKPGETAFPKYFPGWVEARLADGRALVRRFEINTGNPDNPLSREALEAKFRGNVRGLMSNEAAGRVISAVDSLEDTAVADLVRTLAQD
ncbi:MAG: MmgE/PrpD family protein [Burkholderiales bacterium]|nr:MmgE/PrpD family protein [Burkholderiales bacterium]